MQSIGERLEEARKRKGISIREAAEATKIRTDYLHKFEGNSFDLNLPEIYVRGFLRNYANLLKLPADKIVADYRALGLGEKKSGRSAPTRELYGRMDLSGGSSPAEGKSAPAGTAPLASPSASSGSPPAPTASSQGSNFMASLARPSIDPSLIIKGGVIALAAILLVVLVVWGGRALFTRGSAETSDPALEATQPIPEETFTLIALDAVRVKVVQEFDGLELYQGSMARGETRVISRRGPVLITANVGRNLEIEIRGERKRMPFEDYNRATLP